MLIDKINQNLKIRPDGPTMSSQIDEGDEHREESSMNDVDEISE